MVCIYCSGKTKVINSRSKNRPNEIWRRRKCQNCLSIFTSYETVSLDKEIRFQKRDKTLVDFSRDRLFVDIFNSCKHRPNALKDASALVATIIAKTTPVVGGATITRNLIVATTYGVLKNFDKVAYVHYSAFYKPS